jgi:hypothetical protein
VVTRRMNVDTRKRFRKKLDLMLWRIHNRLETACLAEVRRREKRGRRGLEKGGLGRN